MIFCVDEDGHFQFNIYNDFVDEFLLYTMVKGRRREKLHRFLVDLPLLPSLSLAPSSTMHCLVARPFRAICTHLYPQRFCLRPALLSNSRRSFAHSPALFRNKSKAPTKTTDAVAEEDPLDFSKLQNGIATAVSRLKDDLSKFRAGGRFNTATLESLRVHLSNDSKESVRLGDLAQVVPRGGRTVTILATEDDVS